MKSQRSALKYGDGIFTKYSKDVIDESIELLGEVKGLRVLDVGIGNGYAAGRFIEKGAVVVGITMDEEEISFGRSKGHDVRNMDMSFLEFGDAEFDLVWARHCLEHSIMPFFNISEFARVLKPGGKIYVEVPSTNTNSHEHNPNHFSVMSDMCWFNLLKRVGIGNISAVHLDFNDDSGKLLDRYYRFIGVKLS